MKTLTSGMPDPALLPASIEAAESILKLLHTVSPYDWLDMDFYIPNICKAFTPEGIQKYQAYSIAFMTGTLTAEQTGEYKHGILLGRITPVLAQLAFSLREFKASMTQFALELDAAESNRTPDGLAELFGRYFTQIVRFAPSACNTQPWIVENTGNELLVYRFKKPDKRGIMPADKVRYYNKIDMGIFLFLLETCIEHENYTYDRTLFADTTDDSIEQTLIAKYSYFNK